MATEVATVSEIVLIGAAPRAMLATLAAARGLELTCVDSSAAAIEAGVEERLVVVEVERPALPGAADTLAALVEHGAGPLVFVCEEIRAWELRAALVAGAAGAILASELEGALGPCLDAVLAGQVCVPRHHSAQLEPPNLSNREKQVLGLVVMGQTNSQIASRLFVAESTVKSHLSSAFGKLGVRSRNEAVDLILDPDRGLGMGILGISPEQVG